MSGFNPEALKGHPAPTTIVSFSFWIRSEQGIEQSTHRKESPALSAKLVESSRFIDHQRHISNHQGNQCHQVKIVSSSSENCIIIAPRKANCDQTFGSPASKPSAIMNGQMEILSWSKRLEAIEKEFQSHCDQFNHPSNLSMTNCDVIRRSVKFLWQQYQDIFIQVKVKLPKEEIVVFKANYEAFRKNLFDALKLLGREVSEKEKVQVSSAHHQNQFGVTSTHPQGPQRPTKVHHVPGSQNRSMHEICMSKGFAHREENLCIQQQQIQGKLCRSTDVMSSKSEIQSLQVSSMSEETMCQPPAPTPPINFFQAGQGWKSLEKSLPINQVIEVNELIRPPTHSSLDSSQQSQQNVPTQQQLKSNSSQGTNQSCNLSCSRHQIEDSPGVTQAASHPGSSHEVTSASNDHQPVSKFYSEFRRTNVPYHFRILELMKRVKRSSLSRVNIVPTIDIHWVTENPKQVSGFIEEIKDPTTSKSRESNKLKFNHMWIGPSSFTSSQPERSNAIISTNGNNSEAQQEARKNLLDMITHQPSITKVFVIIGTRSSVMRNQHPVQIKPRSSSGRSESSNLTAGQQAFELNNRANIDHINRIRSLDQRPAKVREKWIQHVNHQQSRSDPQSSWRNPKQHVAAAHHYSRSLAECSRSEL